MLGRQPEQGFERNMAVEAAIVTKSEFVEISVEAPAARPVIRAKAPSLQQCENSANPWQDDMSRHFADHARIVPIVGQSRIGRVAVGDQGGSALHIGSAKASIEAAELSAIMARRTRPERVSRYFACLRRGLD